MFDKRFEHDGHTIPLALHAASMLICRPMLLGHVPCHGHLLYMTDTDMPLHCPGCSPVGSDHCVDWHVLPCGARGWIHAAALPSLGHFCLRAKLHSPQAQHSAGKMLLHSFDTSSESIMLDMTDCLGCTFASMYVSVPFNVSVCHSVCFD